MAPRGQLRPIRVVEATTADVAFLAAGTIIQSRGHVQGLTTGAAMWLAGAVSVAVGVGLYLIAVLTSILALIILAALSSLPSLGSDNGSPQNTQRLTVFRNAGPAGLWRPPCARSLARP